MKHNYNKMNFVPLIPKIMVMICFVVCSAFLIPGYAFAVTGKIDLAVKDSSANVFIKAVVSKPSPYAGEVFTVKYLLYYAVPIVDPQNPITFSFKDAFFEEYPNTDQHSNELIAGKNYQVVLVRKLAVVAYNPGVFNIPPITLKLKVNSQPDPDDFFGADKATIQKISSPAKQLEIRALPVKTDTARFGEAVGAFTINAKFSRIDTQTRVLHVTINIKGNGNLKTARFNAPVLPPGVDLFDEKSLESHQLNADGMLATHVYEFSLAANYRGDYQIGSFNLLYFDPVGAHYVQIISESFSWNVASGPVMPPVKVKDARKTAGKKTPGTLLIAATLQSDHANGLFYNTTLYYLALALILMLFTGGLIYEHSKKERALNAAYYQYKKARKIAVKQIKQLELTGTAISDELFSKQLLAVFYQYLANRNVLKHSATALAHALKQISMPSPALEQVLDFVHDQHHTRFSVLPQAGYDRAEQCSVLLKIINSINNQQYDEMGSGVTANL